MLNRNNAHFEELRRIGYEFEEKRRAHEEKKQQILEDYGWESDELKAWYEEKKEMTYPVEAGACKAYRAWSQSVENEKDEVEMDDFLWDREVKDFVEAMREAGIESFIYTNSSTALMENMHRLTDEGCRMGKLVKISRQNLWREPEEVLGIRFFLH